MPTQKPLLNILCFLLASVVSGGLYRLSPLLMNLLLLTSLIIFSWDQIQKDKGTGEWLNKFDIKKIIVFLLYTCFLLAYFLREVRISTEYRFNAFTGEEGTIRQYTDLVRGFTIFLLVGVTYKAVNQSKIIVILPLLCLSIISFGVFLEVSQIIDFNTETPELEAERWDSTADDKLLKRPGGFFNANMTAAVAMIWLYIALESKINSSGIVKGLALLLAVSICLIEQSRAAILFLTIYGIHKLILLRNINLLISIILGGFCLILALSYVAPVTDFATELLDRFTSRAEGLDDSAIHRMSLIVYAINSFQDAPLFGNGIYYLAKTEGHGSSSHNQTLEVLTNFGLIGFLMIAIVYITFYHKNSISYLSLCTTIPCLLSCSPMLPSKPSETTSTSLSFSVSFSISLLSTFSAPPLSRDVIICNIFNNLLRFPLKAGLGLLTDPTKRGLNKGCKNNFFYQVET